jgi:hypothetical protein
LNGFLAGAPALPSLFGVPLLVSVLMVFAGDGMGEVIEPNRCGKVSVSGDREFGSKDTVEFTSRGPP